MHMDILVIELPFLSALSMYPHITFEKKIICTSQAGKKTTEKIYDLPMAAPKVSGKTWMLGLDYHSSA